MLSATQGIYTEYTVMLSATLGIYTEYTVHAVSDTGYLH